MKRKENVIEINFVERKGEGLAKRDSKVSKGRKRSGTLKRRLV